VRMIDVVPAELNFAGALVMNDIPSEQDSVPETCILAPCPLGDFIIVRFLPVERKAVSYSSHSEELLAEISGSRHRTFPLLSVGAHRDRSSNDRSDAIPALALECRGFRQGNLLL